MKQLLEGVRQVVGKKAYRYVWEYIAVGYYRYSTKLLRRSVAGESGYRVLGQFAGQVIGGQVLAQPQGLARPQVAETGFILGLEWH